MKQGAATTSEGVLANFFNSLLSKKTGGLAGGQPGPVGAGPAAGPGPGGVKPPVGADDCEYCSVSVLLPSWLHGYMALHGHYFPFVINLDCANFGIIIHYSLCLEALN